MCEQTLPNSARTHHAYTCCPNQQGQVSDVKLRTLRADVGRWHKAFGEVLRDLGKLPAQSPTATTRATGGGDDGDEQDKKPGQEEDGVEAVTPELVLDVLKDLQMERALMLRTQARAVWGRRVACWVCVTHNSSGKHRGVRRTRLLWHPSPPLMRCGR